MAFEQIITSISNLIGELGQNINNVSPNQDINQINENQIRDNNVRAKQELQSLKEANIQFSEQIQQLNVLIDTKIESIDSAIQSQNQNVGQTNMAKNKVFNLKKAQIQEEIPNQDFSFPEENNMDDNSFLNDTQINMEKNNNQNQNLFFKIWSSPEELRQTFLDSFDKEQVRSFFITAQNGNSEKESNVEDIIDQYYLSKPGGETQGKLSSMLFYDYLPIENKDVVKDESSGYFETEGYGSPEDKAAMLKIENEIFKTAQKYVKKEENKVFNLKKTAQHKTIENVVTYGPSEKRFDAFLREPVSDWSIVERNKGFGLVVDDIWNIDYEAIWRGTIMDKYSREYRDKDGNWVGGYLNKRFEIDRQVPVTSNYQLKPGQKRKPILPEYGNLESRLQFQRENSTKKESSIYGEEEFDKDIKKASSFNLKEINKKKIAQIPELPPIKPLGLKGDEKPHTAQRVCGQCGSPVDSGDVNTDTAGAGVCHNCGSTNIIITEPKFTPDKPGNKFNPYSNNPDKNPQNIAASSKCFNLKKATIEDKEEQKDDIEEDMGTARDSFVSKEFLQCIDPNEKRKKVEDITKSCIDLEIDG